MKRIVLTLCIFVALSSLAHAARFYECTDKEGNTIITNTTPPPGAICEGMGGGYESTPRDRERGIANRIDEIKKINQDNLTPSEKQQLISELLNMKAEWQQIKEKREGERQEGQRAELYSRITKGMSPVEVKKILGEPFHTEMGTSGFSTIYFDTWTYTNGNDDCIVRFQCSRSCRVIKLTIKKTK